MGTDSRAKQSSLRVDRFQRSFDYFMGGDRTSGYFNSIDLVDGCERFVFPCTRFFTRSIPHVSRRVTCQVLRFSPFICAVLVIHRFSKIRHRYLLNNTSSTITYSTDFPFFEFCCLGSRVTLISQSLAPATAFLSGFSM